MKSTPEDPAWNEQSLPYKQEVRGSSPRPPTNPKDLQNLYPSRLAAEQGQNVPERSNNAVIPELVAEWRSLIRERRIPSWQKMAGLVDHIERLEAELREHEEEHWCFNPEHAKCGS